MNELLTLGQMTTPRHQRALPRYRCHKEVGALFIAGVDGKLLFPANDSFGPIQVTDEYLTKHKPQAGGYYVLYADGYESFSPAEAFEQGYTPI